MGDWENPSQDAGAGPQSGIFRTELVLRPSQIPTEFYPVKEYQLGGNGDCRAHAGLTPGAPNNYQRALNSEQLRLEMKGRNGEK